jgi:hypothetical protein
MDGDDRADTVELVESRGAHGDNSRFGIRARMTAYGTQTVWWDYGEGFNDAQELLPLVDIGGDGRREIVVKVGTSVSSSYYGLVALAGRQLVLVSRSGLEDGGAHGFYRASWGCRGALVYTARSETNDDGATNRGTRIDYRLVGGKLVKQRTVPLSWRGDNAPAEFTKGLETC